MVDTNIKEVVGWKENFLGSQRGGSPWCCGYKMSGVLGLRKHRSSIGRWTSWSSRCLGSRRSSRSSSTSTTLCSGRSKSLPALRLRTTALACNMNKVCKKNYIRCIHSCVVEVIYKQIQDSYNSSDKCYSCCSYVCFVLVGCFGWRNLPAQSPLPLECWSFIL